MSDSFRVVAIIAAFNEGDIISRVIGYLVNGGISVYLIDNHSTDDTVEQAKSWLGHGLLHIETFPMEAPSDGSSGKFDWTAILTRKEMLARELQADWFIHHDADEIRESPWPGLSLKDAIQWVDRLSYNCIDFRVFNFSPIDDGFKQGDDPRDYFTLYDNVADFDKVQIKCWKATSTPISLVNAGGHSVDFLDRRIFPIPFILRHYSIRGQSHGLRKVFLERKNRLLDHEHSQGWHIQYDMISDEKYNFLHNPKDLHPFDLDRVRLELMMPEEVMRDLAERLSRTDAELKSARLQQRDAGQGMRAYRQHAKELDEHVSHLQQENSDMTTRVINLERGLDEYRQHTASLERVRKELDEHVSHLQRENSNMTTRVINLERGLDEYRQHTASLERVRKELDEHVSHLQQENSDMTTRVINLERGLDEYRQHTASLERVRKELDKHVSHLQQENSDLTARAISLRNSRSWRWTRPVRWVAQFLMSGSKTIDSNL